jgi:Na+-driven multidrug efflux pump
MPAALGQMIMSVSFLFLNRVVVSIDPLALTAFSLCGRFDQVVLMPIFAVGSALITLVGQNAGRGLFSRVTEIWKKGVVASLGIVAFAATLMVIFAPRIYPFFSTVDGVVRYAVLQTRIMEYTFLLAVIGILGRSVFQAIGHPLPALVLTLLRLVVIAIPAVYLYVYAFDLQMYGVWLGLITGNFTSGVVGLFWISKSLKRLRSGELTVAGTG